LKIKLPRLAIAGSMVEISSSDIMIIDNVKLVRTANTAKYAWSRIAKFQNTRHTSELISQLHSLSNKQRKNTESQAEQIKYCLAQAKEYFDAAFTVSLATRPVLLYYATMSMALAEILLKQTGNSRLPKLREQHNCHGLQLILGQNPNPDHSLTEAASILIAKVQSDATGNPRGTFEMWRRSAREYPVGSYVTMNFTSGGQQIQFKPLMIGVDRAPKQLPRNGISLLECLRQLPYMDDVLNQFGSSLNMIRATIQCNESEAPYQRFQNTIIQPADQSLLDAFMDSVKFEPSCVNSTEIVELKSGYVVKQHLSPLLGYGGLWPYSICLDDKEVHFSCSATDINEFGCLYIALHIGGNFARYYPDVWLKHIERSSPLAITIDELCHHAFDRLSLLILSEFERSYHVLES
jgi:hypothetical protein